MAYAESLTAYAEYVAKIIRKDGLVMGERSAANFQRDVGLDKNKLLAEAKRLAAMP